jgi:hypothetical protein
LRQIIEFVINDRWQFINENYQIILIMLNQTLVNESVREKLVMQLSDKFKQLLEKLQELIDSDPTIPDDVTGLSLIKLITGQLSTSFILRYKFEVNEDDELLVKQITDTTLRAISK